MTDLGDRKKGGVAKMKKLSKKGGFGSGDMEFSFDSILVETQRWMEGNGSGVETELWVTGVGGVADAV